MIGWSRDIKGVPKSGRARFDDIGNLSVVEHANAKNIDLSDIKFQQMLGRYEAETPVDPIDWRGAVYAMGDPKKINRGEGQPPPEPDAWMVGFMQNFAGSRSDASIVADENAIRIQTDTTDYGGLPTATACVYYVGRMPAGTKLSVQLEMKSENEVLSGWPAVGMFRGWPAGWFGNETGQGEGVDYTDYAIWEKRPRDNFGKYDEYKKVIEVVPGFEDIWIALEVRSNLEGRDRGKFNIGYFRNVKIELA